MEEDDIKLLGQFAGAGAAGLAGYAAAQTGKSDLQALQGKATEQIQGIRDTIGGFGEFTPYAVTGGSGSVGVDATGAMSYGQTAQQQALQNQAGNLLTNVGQGAYGLGGLAPNAFAGAQTAMNANTGQFASQLGGQYAALGENMLGAQAPSDLAMLQGQFAGQASMYPTGASQGLQGLQGLQGQADFSGSGVDVTGAYSGINAPNVSTAAGGLASQALGQTNLGATASDVTNAYSGITAPDVRTGAGTAAEQYLAAGGSALSADTPTAQSVYDQIRTTQTPEEERSRIALENRLAAQGRLGVSTAAYGGTPEQLAQAKAEAEARNTASVQALQTADTLATSQQNRAAQLTQMGLSAEQAQAQMNAEGFGQEMSLAGSQLQTAQTQEALQSSVQNRQAQLAQLGLSADQIQAQLASEGFSQQMQLGQGMLQSQQAQSDLDSASQARAAQLAQLGMSAEQIGSQLASEGLNRQVTSATTAAQLAQTGSGIQAQQQQLGQGLLGLGLEAQQLGGSLGAQDIANASNLYNMGSQASALGGQLDQQQIANLTGLLGASDITTQQLLAQNAQALQTGQLGQAQSLAQMNALTNLGVSELGMLQELGLGESTLTQEYIKSLGNIGAGLAGIDF